MFSFFLFLWKEKLFSPGKEWGDPQGFPWLGIHGWLDNAGKLSL
jgi:hypothetical protein